ncbi:MAG: O-succinylhomoserine sulfhydrylase [Azospirillum sp.]|nr:O-succinylhomoserine sulfhydrylase [Azospirillum sp.]
MTAQNSGRAQNSWRARTRLVHGGTERSRFDETCEAIFQTSGYVYQSADECEAAFANDGSRYVYSRFRNPTVAMFEDRIAAYEGAARAFATASGMAAVNAALMCQLKAGDHIVAPHALFGSCLYIVKDLAPKYGIRTTLVDGTDLEQWRAALSQPTTVVFLESPSNPCLEVVDLRAIAELAHAAGARVVVDNVFATPVLQRPLQLGADVVVYSATKHIDGQGRCLGGVVLCDNAFAELLHPYLRHTGPALAPFNAWLLLKGLETLELRVAAQVASAAAVAGFLEGHPAVAKTIYPGLESHPQHALAQTQMSGGGPLVCFEIKGGKPAAFRAMNALELILISNNLGDSKSLICHPGTSTHQRLTDAERARVGIGPATVRLSVGLEDADDLIADLDQALARSVG